MVFYTNGHASVMPYLSMPQLTNPLRLSAGVGPGGSLAHVSYTVVATRASRMPSTCDVQFDPAIKPPPEIYNQRHKTSRPASACINQHSKKSFCPHDSKGLFFNLAVLVPSEPTHSPKKIQHFCALPTFSTAPQIQFAARRSRYPIRWRQSRARGLRPATCPLRTLTPAIPARWLSATATSSGTTCVVTGST